MTSFKGGRVYIGVWNDNEEEVWCAANQAVSGQYLITMDLALGGHDPRMAERYKAALMSLSEVATARQDLSQFTWLFSTSKSLEEVFNLIAQALEPEHHSFTVIELTTGEGLAFNAKRKIIFEISSDGR